MVGEKDFSAKKISSMSGSVMGNAAGSIGFYGATPVARTIGTSDDTTAAELVTILSGMGLVR